MDRRLSKPKEEVQVDGKVYKNSFTEMQLAHQKSVYRSEKKPKKSYGDDDYLNTDMGLSGGMNPIPEEQMTRSFTMNYSEYPKNRKQIKINE